MFRGHCGVLSKFLVIYQGAPLQQHQRLKRCSLYHNPLDFVNAKFQLILTLRCERAVPQLLDKLFDFGQA